MGGFWMKKSQVFGAGHCASLLEKWIDAYPDSALNDKIVPWLVKNTKLVDETFSEKIFEGHPLQECVAAGIMQYQQYKKEQERRGNIGTTGDQTDLHWKERMNRLHAANNADVPYKIQRHCTACKGYGTTIDDTETITQCTQCPGTGKGMPARASWRLVHPDYKPAAGEL